MLSAEREITLDDIGHFAEFTGDTFYAHTDEEAAAANPFFPGRVAHGYLLVSWAAGLFVDPEPGPVLANYGLENLRFVTPVSPGDSIRVALTAKQITPRETDEYGEVRWDAVISNQRDELVAQLRCADPRGEGAVAGTAPRNAPLAAASGQDDNAVVEGVRHGRSNQEPAARGRRRAAHRVHQRSPDRGDGRAVRRGQRHGLAAVGRAGRRRRRAPRGLRGVPAAAHHHAETGAERGDLVVAEASLDYGGPVYKTVFVFEFRGGRIARETAYWSEPFDPPAWRSQWVEVSPDA